MKYPVTDRLVMLAELPVKPDKVDELLDFTVENLSVGRSFPGNLQFDMLVDEGRPERVFFYEVWESSEAQQAYMAWRARSGDLTKLLSLLAGEPKFVALRCIADPSQSGQPQVTLSA